jgi:hypothetical protein
MFAPARDALEFAWSDGRGALRGLAALIPSGTEAAQICAISTRLFSLPFPAPREGLFEREAKRSTPPPGRARRHEDVVLGRIRSLQLRIRRCVLASHSPITPSRRVFIPLRALGGGWVRRPNPEKRPFSGERALAGRNSLAIFPSR